VPFPVNVGFLPAEGRRNEGSGFVFCVVCGLDPVRGLTAAAGFALPAGQGAAHTSSRVELPLAIAIVLLIAIGALGFLCAVAETALFSLGRWKVRQWREESGRAAMTARLLERPEEVLAALSLANTLANGMVAVTSLLLAVRLGWNVWMTLGIAFLAVLLCGEILPKTLAARDPERWALRVAPAAGLLQKVSQPFRRLAQAAIEGALNRVGSASRPPLPITDEEYRELLEMAVQQGTLRRSEKEIIAELITLDRKAARDVMRPRATMAAVPDDLPAEEMVSMARRLRRRRLPVYDETPDTIVGVLNTHQFLLDPEHRLDEAIEFPSFVPETMNLLRLFQSLQQQKRNLAIVLDEFGAVAGVVRMEDILAEVLGEMSGEAAGRGFVMERLGRGRWRVSGSMRIDDFQREYPTLPEVSEIETLGGLLMAQLDIVPGEGQSATVHGLKLTANVVTERRVVELMVERVSGR
jgi:CBS domain containing-hemolysin-like protein